MSRKHIELGIQILHIYLDVRNRLCSVYQYRYIVLVSDINHLLNWVYRTQYIGYMHYGNQSGSLGEQTPVGIHTQFALLVDRYHLEGDSFFGSLYLPGNDVGMVFHDRQNHFVAFIHTCIGKRGCNQVDGFGGTPCKYNLVGMAGIEKLLDCFSSLLVCLGGSLTQEVHPTVYIGIYIVITLFDLFHNATRFLGCGSVVKINQILSVYLTGKNREIRTDSLNI